MSTGFAFWDYVVFALYAVVIVSVGLWVSRDKKGHEKNAEDYFLAGKTLPWWAIGASLIAANISAEQFIGMSGSGFAMGLAIASYEWMAALTLIIVGKYFLPIFIEKGLYTIPEFIEKRYSITLKSILAVFWVALFVFVNLTSVLFLGGKALDTILGNGDGSILIHSIIGLALFAAAYSLWGGLSAVAWTDVIQVILLVIGGLITTVIALNHVTPDGGIVNGFSHILDKAPDHFHMILDKDHPEYMNLPGIAVLVGGLWVANLYYWGFNQYIIQRTLAAKSLKESQRGIVFAAFLKLIVPLIVVIPGIIAYVMYKGEAGTAIIDGVQGAFNIGGKDNAYPWLISTFVPTGLKGLVVAALAAAIVSSLASMLNSTATIFTMDIYKQNINPKANDKSLVTVGRLSATIALVIAVVLAPFLGSIDQMFQYIQEYTGLVSPGILAVFILGLFYKKATNKGAIWGILLSAVIAFYFKIGPKGIAGEELSWLFPTLPWMHQMMLTWIISMGIIVAISLVDGKGKASDKAITISGETFKTGNIFNIASFAIIIVLVVLYAAFW
ncbi:sodium/glucose cotransporter [Prolixibacteraceae bacterium JC049]|nr:sodium/glucose cotransporter [Prolixibacteraceae bacterium JC049]